MYAATTTSVSTDALVSGWRAPPPALRTTAAGAPTTSAASAPWTDHAATRGSASSRIRIAAWTIHVPGDDSSPQEAANRPQPLDSPIAVAAARPRGGQPSKAIARRPADVVGARKRGRPGLAAESGGRCARTKGGGGSPPEARPRSGQTDSRDARDRVSVRASASSNAGPGSRAGSARSSSGPTPSPSPSRTGPPPADRRARRWYSGPCLRGSAYSFGLIVQ